MKSRNLAIVAMSLVLAAGIISLVLLALALPGPAAQPTTNTGANKTPTAPAHHATTTPVPTPPLYVFAWHGVVSAVDVRTGKVLWHRQVSAQANERDFPVQHGDVVYCGTSSAIYAMRAGNGALLWQAPIGAWNNGFATINTSPIFGAQNVYFLTGPNGMVALRMSDGQKQWAVDGGSQRNDGYGAAGAPVLQNGVVYFGASTLYAVNAADGTVLWKYHDTTPNPADANAEGFAVNGAINVANGMIYFTGEDREYYALHAADGTLAWKYATNSVVAAFDGNQIPIVFGQGTLYYTNIVGALDAMTGKLKWSKTIGTQELGQTIFVSNGTFIYQNGQDVRGGLDMVAVSDADGHSLWSMSSPRCALYQPVQDANLVYMAGPLACGIDTTSGHLLWTSNALNDGGYVDVFAQRVIDGHLIAIHAFSSDGGEQNPKVTALNGTDGSVAWNIALP